MKKLSGLILGMVLTHCCLAQQATVKGIVSDTLNHVQLSNTVVALLQAKDSILYKFTRSDEKGHFELTHLQSGKYLLLISYPAFADYVEPLTLSDTSAVQLDNIMLTLKSRLLQEVVIQQKVAAIKMKGDTTEFNAGSYETAANASVEELLKKLPGIQVNGKGQITAQGETVKKVLVDGEEFFGDDPTLVTKNLRADMVDKVQLYDKKSDQAAFTGIDDGERSKTINIQLKEDKKRGYFGKVAVGAGDNGFHDSQAMLNVFRGKKKLAAFGIVSNTGKVGLDWGEREKFGSGSGEFSFNDDGDVELNFRGDDLDSWDGRYGGDGYPLVQTGGLHYSDKWDRDRQNLNANYKLMKLYIDGNSESMSQNILPDTIYYNHSKEHFNNNILRNRVSGSYERQLDSSSSVKLQIDGGLDHKISNRLSSSGMELNDITVNQGERKTSNVSDIGSMNANFLWRKKLKKKGRTISLNLAENYTRTNGEGMLDAYTEYYKQGKLDSVQNTDQLKTTNNESISIVSNFTYTEPLSVASSLLFNYGINIDNNHSNRNSYNQQTDGKYTALDSLYSNDYAFNILTHKGGIRYGYTKNKIRINIGGNVGLTSFSQKDMFRNTKVERDFVNWYPRAMFRYSFSQQRRLTVEYNGYTSQPGIDDLQPIRVNDDPLHLQIGNPALKPSFNNNFSINFNDFKVMTNRSIWASLRYGSTTNAISDRTVIDTSGVSTSQAVNVNGNRSAQFNLYIGWKINPWDLRVGGRANGGLNRNVNYVNGLLNTTNSSNAGLGINLGKYKDKKYEYSLEGEANFNNSVSSVDKSLRTQYWTYNISPNVSFFLPLKFVLHADLNYNIRQKTAVFATNNNAAILNAYVAKKFGKKELVQINLSMSDILNQNIGFNRSVSTNTISQRTYSTIGRYGLLSFIWNFNKLGAAAPKE
ncbi:outer membrane beta-barrel protein [Chitinophaga sp. RCC_12]|uniref:outer membrane beta-barrel protein n=1 Tax=Chitinophaga sp. RCC_12 TaxID=3239226 RepID=UPI0035255A48